MIDYNELLQKSNTWLKTATNNKADALQQHIYKSFIDQTYNHFKSIALEDNHDFNQDFFLKLSFRFFYPYGVFFRTPFELPGMVQAVEIIRQYWYSVKQENNKKKLLIYADRDADGVTSSSIIYLFLTQTLGIDKDLIKVELPQEEDKYGLTEAVADRLLPYQPDVFIALDLGSSNKDSFEYFLNNLNKPCEVIVLDHHTIPESRAQYPEVEAFINPKRLSISHWARDLCSAGLAWFFTEAVTYSFTREYNSITRISDFTTKKDIYLKNGVTVDAAESYKEWLVFHHEKDNIPEGAVSGDYLWQGFQKTEKAVHETTNFLNQFAGALHLPEKYWSIKMLLMKNVSEKTRRYLGLAAVGTIADVMPLIHENKILVYEGLDQMRNFTATLPPGLHELLMTLRLNLKTLSEQDISFSISPVVNAAGRLGRAQIASEAMIQTDAMQAKKLAAKLNELNKQRKELSKQAIELVENVPVSAQEKVVVIFHDQIHRGISGLVAGKLTEKFRRPVIVLVNDNECLRGSARSYLNEDIFTLLHSIKDIFIQFGGHRQAAGFSLEKENLDSFKSLIKEKADQLWQVATSAQQQTPEAEQTHEQKSIKLKDREITPVLWQSLLRFAPYGPLNPHPVLAIHNTEPVRVKTMGEQGAHARLTFSGIVNSNIEGVWFFHNNNIETIEPGQKYIWHAEPHFNYFRDQMKYQLKIKKVDT